MRVVRSHRLPLTNRLTSSGDDLVLSVALDPNTIQQELLLDAGPRPGLMREIVAALEDGSLRPDVIAPLEVHIRWGQAILDYDRLMGRHRLLQRESAILGILSFFMRYAFRIGDDKYQELEAIAEKLEPDDVRCLFPDDPWLQNFITSAIEYKRGETQLTTYPWNITLPIADLCNARCTFCTSWLSGRALIKLEQVDAFKELLAKNVYLGLVGHGEPMAHPQFRELSERLMTYMDPRATLYTITNGYYLPDYEEEISKLNLLSYSISLNAASAETHDVVMGLGKDGFDRAIRGIQQLIHLRETSKPALCVYITMVVTAQNVHEAADFVRLGNELDVTGIWFRSLLPLGDLIEGLNYHTLSPNLHPEFGTHLARAVEAIAASRVPVQATPSDWGQEVLSPALRREVELNPPRFVERSEALKDKALRRKATHLYNADRTKYVGQRRNSTGTQMSFEQGQLRLTAASELNAHAASFRIPLSSSPNEEQVKRSVRVSFASTKNRIGIGVLTDKDEWRTRDVLPAGFAGMWEADAPQEPARVVLFTGDPEGIGRAQIDSLELVRHGSEAETPPEIMALPLTEARVHNAQDPLEDGLNPLNRSPRFACRAVYYNYYVNEMFFRINPCCYLTAVPEYEPMHFDGTEDFMTLWNSPAMVALRTSLKEGPLLAACRRCPEKW
jgi:pyruvate-formate lyase-activating enzyme